MAKSVTTGRMELHVHERLKLARERAGYPTALRLAQDLGIPVNNVYRWERGDYLPNTTSVVMLAQACGVSTDWLLTGKGPGPRKKPLETHRGAAA